MSEYAKNIQTIEDMWKKRIELRMGRTDGIMTELLPCPFCGGEAQIIESDYGMYLTGYAVYCKGECHVKLGVSGRLGEAYEWTPVFDTEAEAIAAWNSRAERTCNLTLDGTDGCFGCSRCYENIPPLANYCPNCGAKVVNL